MITFRFQCLQQILESALRPKAGVGRAAQHQLVILIRLLRMSGVQECRRQFPVFKHENDFGAEDTFHPAMRVTLSGHTRKEGSSPQREDRINPAVQKIKASRADEVSMQKRTACSPRGSGSGRGDNKIRKGQGG